MTLTLRSAITPVLPPVGDRHRRGGKEGGRRASAWGAAGRRVRGRMPRPARAKLPPCRSGAVGAEAAGGDGNAARAGARGQAPSRTRSDEQGDAVAIIRTCTSPLLTRCGIGRPSFLNFTPSNG